MGLFDKLKQAKNFITGGSATVILLHENREYDKAAPIKIKINVKVKDAPVSPTAVYLDIRSKESVDLNVSVNGKKEHIKEDHFGYKDTVKILLNEELQALQSYDWELEFTLPSTTQPTFHGHLSHFVWEIKGALDVKGNDPDSGWVEVRVK
jgi:hypothetical protein